jgi:hypothetical protein
MNTYVRSVSAENTSGSVPLKLRNDVTLKTRTLVRLPLHDRPDHRHLHFATQRARDSVCATAHGRKEAAVSRSTYGSDVALLTSHPIAGPHDTPFVAL